MTDRAGYVAGCDCEAIGQTLIVMGAGRQRKEDTIDHHVGIAIHVRIGDRVERGQPIMTLHHTSRFIREESDLLKRAIKITDQEVESRPLILQRL